MKYMFIQAVLTKLCQVITQIPGHWFCLVQNLKFLSKPDLILLPHTIRFQTVIILTGYKATQKHVSFLDNLLTQAAAMKTEKWWRLFFRGNVLGWGTMEYSSQWLSHYSGTTKLLWRYSIVLWKRAFWNALALHTFWRKTKHGFET